MVLGSPLALEANVHCIDLEPDWTSLYPNIERTPGWHVSSLVYARWQARVDAGVFKPFTTQTFDKTITMDMGFLWEFMLEQALSDRLGQRIGEVSKDGITGSPDGVAFHTQEDGSTKLVLEEYKFSWKSASQDITKHFMYMGQAMSYCHILQTDTCLFRVLYINGDYGKTADRKIPCLRKHLLTFTQEEMEANWAEMLQMREIIQRKDAETLARLAEAAKGEVG